MALVSPHRIDSLAVVVPAFNEAETLRYSHERLMATLQQVRVASVEIIYVNDGSNDGSGRFFEDLIANHEPLPGKAEPAVTLTYIELSRNFGHSAAVLAGLEAAKADAVAIIDADLQDPPELISGMVEELRKGWDVVFGKRQSRERESVFKRMTAWLFYRTLRLLAGFEIPADTGDFRVMTRQVRNAVLDCHETEPFLRGLVAWVGFRQRPMPYVRGGRKFGRTKYPFRKMMRLATLAILSFSVKPLRIAAWLGALGFGICVVMGLVAVVSWAQGNNVPGWTSLIVAFMTVQSLTLIIIGILGVYIGRIYSEVQRRPRHVIRTTSALLTAAPGGSDLGTRPACRPSH